MHGPRFWLHGVGGHAFFRAEEEIGFPAVPKCVESLGYQLMYCAIAKHVPDFETKLRDLNAHLLVSDTHVLSVASVVSKSPYACCRIVHTMADRLGLPQRLASAANEPNKNTIIYRAFHSNIYTVGATINKLKTVYANRWCKPHLISEARVAGVALSAAKYLRWIARRTPPRVHIANTRFHFNGFHTLRRYQKRTDRSCMFCRKGEDSIEHFVHCPSIHGLFPRYLKSGNPPKVPVGHFFLRDLDGRHRITFALVIYAIYRIHNEFRHSTDHSDFKRCCLRVIADVPLRPEFSKAWKEILCPYGA